MSNHDAKTKADGAESASTAGLERGNEMTEEKTDVGHLIANVLMTSNQDNFDENMTRFLDETAELLGDVIGAACSNPETVFKRFGDCMAETIGKRLASSNG